MYIENKGIQSTVVLNIYVLNQTYDKYKKEISQQNINLSGTGWMS